VVERRSRDDEELRARYVGFCDGNASNFLIVYVRYPGPYSDVDKMPTMVSNGRVTKQGVRDLNHYGPRAGKAVAGAPVAAAVPNETIPPEARPVTPAIGAHEDAITT
jgi:hypothetical protein